MCSLNCCALCCMVMSPVAVLLFIVVGILCLQDSHTLEVKAEVRKDRGVSSFLAAGLYGVVLIICVLYLVVRGKGKKKASNDNVIGEPTFHSILKE